jgi:hypothetical protein
MLWPLGFAPPRDSFPLSSYPMFARARTSAGLTLDYFVAVAPGGERSFVTPDDVGSAEVLQARSAIIDAVRGGRGARQRLCTAVAARLARRRVLGTLRLVRGRHDAIAYLAHGVTGTEKVLATCPISREATP